MAKKDIARGLKEFAIANPLLTAIGIGLGLVALYFIFNKNSQNTSGQASSNPSVMPSIAPAQTGMPLTVAPSTSQGSGEIPSSILPNSQGSQSPSASAGGIYSGINTGTIYQSNTTNNTSNISNNTYTSTNNYSEQNTTTQTYAPQTSTNTQNTLTKTNTTNNSLSSSGLSTINFGSPHNNPSSSSSSSGNPFGFLNFLFPSGSSGSNSPSPSGASPNTSTTLPSGSIPFSANSLHTNTSPMSFNLLFPSVPTKINWSI